MSQKLCLNLNFGFGRIFDIVGDKPIRLHRHKCHQQCYISNEGLRLIWNFSIKVTTMIENPNLLVKWTTGSDSKRLKT